MKDLLSTLFLIFLLTSCSKNDPEFEAKVRDQKKEIINLTAKKKSLTDKLNTQKTSQEALQAELTELKSQLEYSKEETNKDETRQRDLQAKLAQLKAKDLGPDKIVLNDGKEYIGKVTKLERGRLSFFDEETVEEITVLLTSVKEILFRDSNLLSEAN